MFIQLCKILHVSMPEKKFKFQINQNQLLCNVKQANLKKILSELSRFVDKLKNYGGKSIRNRDQWLHPSNVRLLRNLLQNCQNSLVKINFHFDHSKSLLQMCSLVMKQLSKESDYPPPPNNSAQQVLE